MRKSRVYDVLDVLEEIKFKNSASGSYSRIVDLRKNAIIKIAEREYKSGRFKNKESAERTIHDACTRRLAKIHDVYNFDNAVKEWLSDRSHKLKLALEAEASDDNELNKIAKFFNVNVYSKIESPLNSNTIFDSPVATPKASDIEEPTTPERVKQETYRILRDTNLARNVKTENQFLCELCGQSLKLGNGKPYAEAHHIKPLGSPHNGPDTRSNILCVCPNHHVLLDYGAIKLDADKLQNIKSEYIDYHNTQIFAKE